MEQGAALSTVHHSPALGASDEHGTNRLRTEQLPRARRACPSPAAGRAHVFDSLAAALVLVPVPAITSFHHYIRSRHNKAPQAVLCDGTSRLRLQPPGANRGMPFAPTHYVLPSPAELAPIRF